MEWSRSGQIEAGRGDICHMEEWVGDRLGEDRLSFWKYLYRRREG